MAEEHPSIVNADRPQLVAPGRPGGGWPDFLTDRIGHQREQFLLVAHVVVQRGGLDAEPLGQAARGQPVDANVVEEAERFAHDLVTRDELTRRWRLPGGHVGEGRAWRLAATRRGPGRFDT